jgi:hypothetical protein
MVRFEVLPTGPLLISAEVDGLELAEASCRGRDIDVLGTWSGRRATRVAFMPHAVCTG